MTLAHQPGGLLASSSNNAAMHFHIINQLRCLVITLSSYPNFGVLDM